MSTTHPTDVVEAYIADVKARLSGVPEDEQNELLDDVAAHVREVADEHGPEQLRERLGTPEQFGDELRASAGFAPPVATVQDKARRRVDMLRDTKAWRWIVAEWPRVEPAWWLARGVFFVWLATGIVGGNTRLIPDSPFGALALIAGAAASYALAARRPADQAASLRKIRIGAELALAVFAVYFVANAQQTHYVYYDSGSNAYQPDPCLRDSAGRAISNLYGFDLNGRLIQKFFLTDQAGRPIDNLCPDQVEAPGGGQVQTQYSRDANGAPVYNVFPRAQQRIATNEMTGAQEPAGPIVPPAVVFPHVDPNAPTTASTVPNDGTPVG